MPRLSIGLPVHNGERYLKHSVESILSQSFTDFELIISDNASTDSTPGICLAYAAADPRVRYYRNGTNLGASYNFNRVFQLASGEYFKWISYDDICEKDFLRRCIEVLDRDPSCVLCYPKTVLIDERGEKIRNYEDNLELRENAPHKRLGHFVTKIRLANPVFGVIRAGALAKTRLLGKYFGADYILLIELALQGKFHEVKEDLFLRRDHERNSRRLPKKELADWWDSSNGGAYHHIENRHISEQFRAIRRSELGWREKGLCYLQICRWVWRRFRAKGGKYKAHLKDKLTHAF